MEDKIILPILIIVMWVFTTKMIYKDAKLIGFAEGYAAGIRAAEKIFLEETIKKYNDRPQEPELNIVEEMEEEK